MIPFVPMIATGPSTDPARRQDIGFIRIEITTTEMPEIEYASRMRDSHREDPVTRNGRLAQLIERIQVAPLRYAPAVDNKICLSNRTTPVTGSPPGRPVLLARAWAG